MTGQMITQSFDEIVNILANGMMKGDPQMEQFKCIFTTDEPNVIHILSAFDFIDLDPPKNTIKKIALYQLIDKKSIS